MAPENHRSGTGDDPYLRSRMNCELVVISRKSPATAQHTSVMTISQPTKNCTAGKVKR